ncbi:flagellar basal body P-ring formation chaperone FlgA [Neptuniibacter sp. QD29_5]|uniref:flagellar basal body P-ring formation chaperone FlgA n=1 Tax=Neptuniibacter sp. QD29_5 TaxID=3398207 RepID=UPI0039F4819B
MNKHNLTRLFFLTTVLLASFGALAADQTEKLEQEALLFLQEHYKKAKPDARTEIKLNPISRKIKLKNCLQPLEFQSPKGNGSRITFRARCPSPMWQLFVTAQIKLYGTAVISSTSLPRNTRLSSQHIQRTQVDITNIRSAYFLRTEEIIGWTTKRSIAAGTIFTASMLKPPLAVSRGNSVIIEAKRSGVSIRAAGTALEDGSIGQQIKVKNDRSGNIVKAVVIEAGLVRTP